MGFSHPLSDEFDGPRSCGGSPERAWQPPPPASCCPDNGYHEHEVSKMDTLAGIAIKYGVEISDIKRANGLVSDRQMFAHKTLLIPLPGRPIPPPVRFNGSGQTTKRTWALNHQQNKDITDLLDSSKYKTAQQRTSLAMSTLQRYYGLTPQKGESMECTTEMSSYSNGGFRHTGSETLPKASPSPDPKDTDRSWNSENPLNGFASQIGTNGYKSNGATKAKKDSSVRQRQKVESDCLSSTTEIEDNLLAVPIKIVRSLLPRPMSGNRLNMDTSSPDSTPKSNNYFVNRFKSIRKSPSTPNFADSENGISMWSSSKWTLNHESFTRPLLDGLPVSARRTKAALD